MALSRKQEEREERKKLILNGALRVFKSKGLTTVPSSSCRLVNCHEILTRSTVPKFVPKRLSEAKIETGG